MGILEERESKALFIDKPIEYAKELFQFRDFIGAFAVLDSYIAFCMENILDKEYNQTHSGKEIGELSRKEANEGYQHPDFYKKLQQGGHFSKDEIREIKEFRRIRAKLVHGIVKYGFRRFRVNRVTTQEVDRGFEQGILLAQLADSRMSAYNSRRAT